MIDMSRCLHDFEYYSGSLLKIKDKDSNLTPLNLWEPQQRLHKVLVDLQQRNRLQRVIVLKARQEGISTYAEGRMFWSAHFNENIKNVVIAHDKESGQSIFGMCKLFYDCLPKPQRPMIKYNSKRDLLFENPDKKTSHANPGLRSSIEVLTAGKKSVARGVTIHNLHASELASWAFPEDVIPSIIPTIPKNNKSLVIYESTAKGIGNYFYDEWQKAKEGESNFAPFFLAWFDLDEYRHEFNTIQDKEAFKQHLNDEEKELQSTHEVDLEQLYWRRLTIADLRGDVELFRQEYPATDSEAFIVSGSPMFDRRKLRTMAIRCTEPKFRGYFDARLKLIPDEKGELKIWKRPSSDGIYSIGVDVSDGVGRDYSCIEVFKKLHAPMAAEQVAEWHGQVDPYTLGDIACWMGRLFNSALVAVETNAHGIATLQSLQDKYWNLYRQEHFDRYGAQFTNKLGWETGLRTKKLLVSYMSHLIGDMNVIIHSDRLIKECMTFVRDSLEGAASAAGSGYDDRVMAAMIGLFVMHQVIDEEPAESSDFQTIAKPITSSPNYIDIEFQRILQYGKDNVYEQNWMNY